MLSLDIDLNIYTLYNVPMARESFFIFLETYYPNIREKLGWSPQNWWNHSKRTSIPRIDALDRASKSLGWNRKKIDNLIAAWLKT